MLLEPQIMTLFPPCVCETCLNFNTQGPMLLRMQFLVMPNPSYTIGNSWLECWQSWLSMWRLLLMAF